MDNNILLCVFEKVNLEICSQYSIKRKAFYTFYFNKIFTTFFIKIIIQRIITSCTFNFRTISSRDSSVRNIKSCPTFLYVPLEYFTYLFQRMTIISTEQTANIQKKYIKYWNPVHHVPSLCFTNFSPSLSNSSSTFPVFFWHHQFPFSDYILPFH